MASDDKTKRIEARTLKGFQDFFPEDVLTRRRIVRRIEDVFERFGYRPLETPALEALDVLLGAGGENTNKELFRLESPEGEAIALRFDLTVPFARMLSQYPERLKPPIRRYAMGPVWRGDKPGPGRFRQFTQLDIDAAGAESAALDAEVIAVMCAVMAELGAARHTVLINNRKLIDAVLEACGIKDEARQKHVLRIIDKLAKVGLDNLRHELGPGRVDESGDPIRGAGLDAAVIDHILEFIAIQAPGRMAVIAALAEQLPDSPLAAAALDEMRELAEALDALEVSEEHARFDPSLARGLDYYTGPVFEMILPDAPGFGSVMGGGRYNQLVSRFSHQPIACTGMSVGLDRLLAALERLGTQPAATDGVQALVVTMGRVPRTESLRLAQELRAAGIRTEVFIAAKKKMKLAAQLSHADHYGIPVAVILGEDELAQGVVAIKDLHEGKEARAHITERDAYREAGKTGQEAVPRAKAAEAVKAILARQSAE